MHGTMSISISHYFGISPMPWKIVSFNLFQKSSMEQNWRELDVNFGCALQREVGLKWMWQGTQGSSGYDFMFGFLLQLYFWLGNVILSPSVVYSQAFRLSELAVYMLDPVGFTSSFPGVRSPSSAEPSCILDIFKGIHPLVNQQRD